MDVKQFYTAINGNYEEALSRLMMDSIIEKFLIKFKNIQKLDGLIDAVNAYDLDKVFAEAHTLKGVALNLALAPLAEASSILTEMLRGDNKLTAQKENVLKAFNEVQKQYQIVIDNID